MSHWKAKYESAAMSANQSRAHYQGLVRRLEARNENLETRLAELESNPRSNAELVAQCNELAREFYRIEGHFVSSGFKFHASCHPHEQRCWAQAVAAFEVLLGTPMDDVLEEYLEGA